MKTLLLGLTLIFGTALGYYNIAQTTQEAPVAAFDAAVTIKTHADELASDKYRGREAGSDRGDDINAARYVASQFNKIGLEPRGNVVSADNTIPYFQKFRFPGELGDLTTVNVIGMIEGTDLKNEIIVIGAHYDHVGTTSNRHYGQYRPNGGDDTIFNGADDNASGTSTLIAVATMWKNSKIKPRRTMVFIAFGAEEAGLYGSKHYCEHPTIGSITDHVLMINLDMIGRNSDKPVDVVGVGTIYGDTLREAVKVSSSHEKLSVNIIERFKPNGGDSDHSSFNNVKVPNIFFFTGLHADYHRVSDHSDRLDYKNMSKIAAVVFYVSRTMADTTDRLVYLK